MSNLQQKISSHAKRQKTQFEEKEQAPERGSDMSDMLELAGWEFKTTVISIPSTVKKQVENMQEHMGKVSREMETLQTNQKEVREIRALPKKQRTPLITHQ